MIISCVLVCVFGWAVVSSKPDPTQCDIPTNSTELIEQVATVKDSLAVRNHIPDAKKKGTDGPTKTQGMQGVHETDFGNMSSPSDRHEKIKREVLVFISKNCPPCERWKRCEMQKFLDAGWTVGIVEDHNYPLTPTFLIDAADKQTEHRGYLPFEKLKEVVK